MARRLLTIFGYLALAALIVLTTVLLVAYGRGYSYDFMKGRLIGNGLVIIDSVPSGADVLLGGKNTKHKTPYQARIETGSYEYDVIKSGYHSWHKILQVAFSEVTLAQSVLLIPNHPAQTSLDSRQTIVAEAISDDHRHLAYLTGGSEPALYTLDLGNPKPVRLYAAKAATPDEPAETLTDVRWSDDASHLLLTSQLGATAVYQLIGASGGNAVNLTDQYHENFTGLRFSGNNWRQLYWIAADGLRRLDVDAQTVSPVLADNVQQFSIAPDRVLYVQTTSLGRSLWSIDSRGHKQELIQSLAASDTYDITFGAFRGDEEVAIVPSSTHIGTLYSGLFGATPVAKTVAHDVAKSAFSADGHYLTFYSAANMMTYDLERSTVNDHSITYDFNGESTGLTALSWFDNGHLLINHGGRLDICEYDGSNSVDLGTMVPALTPYSTPDLKSVVAIMPSGTTQKINEITLRQ